MVIRPCFVVKTTGESGSGGRVMNFATQIFACSIRSTIGASHDNSVVTLAPVPLSNLETGSESSGKIRHFIWSILRMHLFVSIHISKLYTYSQFLDDSEPESNLQISFLQQVGLHRVFESLLSSLLLFLMI